MTEVASALRVGDVLGRAGLPRREARALLAQVLGVSREALLAHPERPVAADECAAFDALAERLRRGEPIAYVLGSQAFYGREFRVSPAVLIPRPDTETLVEAALERLSGLPAPRVLDLGTGSGCIAITLALEHAQARVVAVDRSAAALDVARANAARLGAGVEFLRGEWYAPARGTFDMIVVNPPYVAAGDPHLAGLAHEPRIALTDEADGLTFLRAVVAGARARLRPRGWLLVEHGFDQGGAVRQQFAHCGFASVETLRDAAGHERVCCGRRKARD